MNILVKKAIAGDADAFVQLMEENKMSMYRVAKGILHNEEDVADAMQETILDSFEHVGQLKNGAYFKTWLTRILINNCNQILRKRKRCDVIAEFPEVSYNDENQANAEFKAMLADLPKDSRVIFQLYYGEGFNAREIGEILRISENTVRSRLRRGKMELRERMAAN